MRLKARKSTSKIFSPICGFAFLNTRDRFVSVSGQIAQGGSIESDGPVIHQGHVLINSGYLFGGRMPGNALLVFAPHGD